ncbi:MAG: hypothetical protein ABFD80_00720 [Acidobacteriota bacterium]
MKSAKRLRRTAVIAAAALILPVFLSRPASANGKKLQVVEDKAVVRLDASEKSPAVETLERGAVLSLASAVKTKMSWFYVYFTSLQSGNTRAGYIHESCVRKLYPSLKVIQISSGDEIVNPAEINLEAPYRPVMDWGTTKDAIVRAEGKPHTNEAEQDAEIFGYRRDVAGKKCQLEYVFDENGLVAIRIRLLENYADKNNYIRDYDKIRGFLKAAAGSPRADRAIWQDHSYEHLNDCWGIALSQGHVEFSSEWVLRDTEVRLTLAGANNHVAFDAELSDVKTRKTASF